ncbi:MAG: divergent polysaccharide deacetylase family protein [Alphaproteobacteria bacterium]
MKSVIQLLTLMTFLLFVFFFALFIKIEFFETAPIEESMAVANIPLHSTRSQARYLSFKERFMRTEEMGSKISLIFSKTATDEGLAKRAFKAFPPAVSFSFSPYEAFDMLPLMQAAQGNNHGILLDIPMETLDYPITNPGSHTILNNADEEVNLSNLTDLLETPHMPSLQAVTSLTGAGISERDVVASVIAELEEREIVFIDQFGRMGTLEEGSDAIIKNDFSGSGVENIKTILEQAKQKALGEKHVIVTLPLTTESFTIVRKWIKTLNPKEVKLARLSEKIQSRK